MKRTKERMSILLIRIFFKKGCRQSVCDFEVPSEEHFNKLHTSLNDRSIEFIKFGQLLFRRTDIDHVILIKK